MEKRIKGLIFLLICIFMVSCNCKSNRRINKVTYEYSVGDVVYTKPDSIRGTVVKRYESINERNTAVYRVKSSQGTENLHNWGIYGLAN